MALLQSGPMFAAAPTNMDDEVVHFLHVDRTDKVARLVAWQDCEPIVEENKRLQNAPKQRGEFRKVATIPNVIAFRWLTEEWARGNPVRYLSPEFDELVKRKLADPDWKWLRTT